nr:exodeoxyribonuclease VII large subunit [Lactobacillus amylovorus]
TLERGFVYTTDANGKTVSSVKQVKKLESLNLHFKDGQVEATVTKIEEENNAN